MSKRLEWKDNKVTVHRIEVRRAALGKLEDRGWRVTARSPCGELQVPASDEADTDSCAHKLALAVLALYDESIPHALVEDVNTRAREFCGGVTVREFCGGIPSKED